MGQSKFDPENWVKDIDVANLLPIVFHRFPANFGYLQRRKNYASCKLQTDGRWIYISHHCYLRNTSVQR